MSNKHSMSLLLEQKSSVHALTSSALRTFDKNCRILHAIERAIDRLSNSRGGLNSLEIAAYELERMHLWPNEQPYYTK